MKQIKFLQIAVFMIALVSLNTQNSLAQTTVTLPTACQSCPSTTSPSTNGTGVVSAYGGAGCTGSATINGTMTAGTAVSGVTMSLYANVTTLGTYNLSATQNGVTFTGTGTFAALGCQLVTLTASGTPTTAGGTTWSTNTTPIGSASATVAAAGPISHTCGITTTLVVDVVSTTGKTWMDRNLGASQVATSSTDEAAYGDYFQWGRACDGHQRFVNSTWEYRGTASTAVPNLGNPWDGKYTSMDVNLYAASDWLNPQNANLWQGVSGTNNPCPSGYRLPTESELNAEYLTFSSNNAAGAFASPLKLTKGGNIASGTTVVYIDSKGIVGQYWASTVNSNGKSSYLYFTDGLGGVAFAGRNRAHSVRCIKN